LINLNLSFFFFAYDLILYHCLVLIQCIPFNNFVFRNGGLHDTSANLHYSILGDSHAGSTSIELLYSRSQGSHVQDDPFDHNSPLTLATADFFYISGTYFIP
jgi:hypothetical protein